MLSLFPTGEDERSRPVTSKMSQTSRHATPVNPNNPRIQLDQYSQTRLPDSAPTPEPNLSSQQSDTDSGDAPLPPLSASPPNSPQPTTTRLRHHSRHSRNRQGEAGDYLPPLSATPPQSPAVGSRQPPPAKAQLADDYHHPNPAAAADELDRQRLEEMMR